MVWTQRSLGMSLEHGTEEKNTALAVSQLIVQIAATRDSSQRAFDGTLNFTKVQNTEYCPQ